MKKKISAFSDSKTLKTCFDISIFRYLLSWGLGVYSPFEATGRPVSWSFHYIEETLILDRWGNMQPQRHTHSRSPLSVGSKKNLNVMQRFFWIFTWCDLSSMTSKIIQAEQNLTKPPKLFWLVLPIKNIKCLILKCENYALSLDKIAPDSNCLFWLLVHPSSWFSMQDVLTFTLCPFSCIFSVSAFLTHLDFFFSSSSA